MASATAIGKRLPSVFQAAQVNRGLNQREMGRIMCLSEKTVSAIETGRRNLPQDMVPKAATALDDPELYSTLQAEATGGVASPWLNGDKVDLHRSSVRDKVIEECSEAIEALAKCRILVNARCAEDLDDEGREQIAHALNELAEAQTACQTAIGVFCRQYGFGVAEVYHKHREDLIRKGYIKG